MTLPFIFHGQTPEWVTNNGAHLRLKLAVEKGVPLSKVMVRHEPDNEEYLVEMTPSGHTDCLNYYCATIPLNTDRDVTHYVFKLLTESAQYWLDAKGVSKRAPAKEMHFKFNANHQPPEWVCEQVFYQIFPDRFCNGKPEISVKDGEYLVSAGTKPVKAKQWGEALSGNTLRSFH